MLWRTFHVLMETGQRTILNAFSSGDRYWTPPDSLEKARSGQCDGQPPPQSLD